MKLSAARSGCFLLLTFCIFSPPHQSYAQTAAPLPIMPLPAHVVQGQGQFIIDGKFGIELQGYTEPRLTRARQRFLDTLSKGDWDSVVA